MTEPTVVIAAGGTGGHIYPGIALAQQLIQSNKSVVWFGSGSKLEQRILSPHSWTYETVRAKPLRGTHWYAKLFLPYHVLVGVLRAWRLLRRYKPLYVITTGGYVSVASTLAARLAGVPVFLCEQNARPGLANRYLSYCVRAIFTAYPNVFSHIKKKKLLQMGNPIRQLLVEHSQRERSTDGDHLRLLILGGSQGAHVFNDRVPILLGQVPDKKRLLITHISGPGADIQSIRDAYQSSGIQAEVHDYVQDMSSVYLKTDLVLARAGALTLSELVQFSLPSLLVPLPNSADNHQFYNALYYHRLGACRLIEQSQLLNDVYLAHCIHAFMSDKTLGRRMRKAAHRLQSSDAAKSIVAFCDSALS